MYQITDIQGEFKTKISVGDDYYVELFDWGDDVFNAPSSYLEFEEYPDKQMVIGAIKESIDCINTVNIDDGIYDLSLLGIKDINTDEDVELSDEELESLEIGCVLGVEISYLDHYDVEKV